MGKVIEDWVTHFWGKVSVKGPDDCWEWQASQNGTGYGKFAINRKNVYAHRMAYQLTYGNIPSNLIVCHSCDNRACCNPRHLWLGTYKDNMRDCVSKGRLHNGLLGVGLKLTSEQVREIRKLYKAGLSNYLELSTMFKVHKATIGKIVRYEIWKGVK